MRRAQVVRILGGLQEAQATEEGVNTHVHLDSHLAGVTDEALQTGQAK